MVLIKKGSVTVTDKAIVVIGASSEIAKAFITEQANRNPDLKVISISKKPSGLDQNIAAHFQCDYSPSQISQVGKSIKDLNLTIAGVTIFNGMLHREDGKLPEKKLEEIDLDYSMMLFNINTMLPMLWLQALLPALKGKHSCVVTALSARVGSISDNQLGGWYSYRSSKAALNMMFKSAAVELARRAKNIKLVLFHPGTTDTPLSKPFQANVPSQKLFSPTFVAAQLSDIIARQKVDGTVSYIDWQNKPIDW